LRTTKKTKNTHFFKKKHYFYNGKRKHKANCEGNGREWHDLQNFNDDDCPMIVGNTQTKYTKQSKANEESKSL
jgi:hypothetical protein